MIRLQKSTLWLLLACLVLFMAIAGLWGYQLRSHQEAIETISLPQPLCSPAVEDCRVDLPAGGSFVLSFSPRPIIALDPIAIHIQLQNFSADMIEIDFAGVDMNMGYNRVQLKNENKEQYTGHGILPVCVTGKMTWRVSVMIRKNDQVLVIPFLMDVGR